MASDQGNPSAFSSAMGGKKKQTLEENSFSLYRNWIWGRGWRWAEPSTAKPLTCTFCHGGAPRAGGLQSCVAPHAFTGLLLFCGEPRSTRAVHSVLLRQSRWEHGVRPSLKAGVHGQWPEGLWEGPWSKSFGRSLCFLSCLSTVAQALQGQV